jgi:hypothetical protein
VIHKPDAPSVQTSVFMLQYKVDAVPGGRVAIVIIESIDPTTGTIAVRDGGWNGARPRVRVGYMREP